MHKRLLLVAALVLLVGFMTKAFAAEYIPVNVDTSLPITRAGAIAVLINANPANRNRVLWYASHMPPMPLFHDTDQRAWYAPYIEVAFEQGLITGNKERLFRPGDALKEIEAIALVTRYKEAQNTSEVFLVIPSAEMNWLNQTISEAQTNSIKIPFPVRPEKTVPRSELFSLMQSAGVESPELISVMIVPVTTLLPDGTTAQPLILQPIASPKAVIATTTPAVQQQPVAQRQPAAQPAPRKQVAQVVQPIITVQPASTQPYLSSKSFAVTMPTLGIKDLSIMHPGDLSHDGMLAPLKNGVGHLFSYPGQGGKILVYGHSSGYPWDVSKFTKVFRQINKLSVGDKVYVTYNGKLYTYQVTLKQTVDANDMSAYAQNGSEELILYTCWPPDSIKQRYLVRAMPVATAVASN